jgi:defect-in-organelle-trafficking protein DotB
MLEATIGDVPRFDLTPGFGAAELREFVNKVYLLGASDLKVQSNDFVWADINRIWRPVTKRRIQASEVDYVLSTLSDQSSLGLISAGEPVDARVDLALSADDVNEFRLNATGCMVNGTKSGCSVTLRAIPKEIPTLAVLGIEKEIVDNFFPRYGLILIVGTTGSGKSTTMAAALRHRLQERRHDPVAILTYENPIEYSLAGLAQGHMPEPSQVGIGAGNHLKNFDMVGPNAMRRRGDVIIMGEIRDIGSANAGCEMSRTGHAVMATLHVDTPGECFDRLIKFFPGDQREGEASAVLSQLRMVIAQKLARRKDGGKIAFRSWVVVDKALKESLTMLAVSEWPRAVAKHITARGNDFESAAYKALISNKITGEVFREVAGLTPEEALTYVAERGGDVSLLDDTREIKIIEASDVG